MEGGAECWGGRGCLAGRSGVEWCGVVLVTSELPRHGGGAVGDCDSSSPPPSL